MTNPSPLAADNVALLEQGLALLERLDDARYLARALPLAPIGQHLRHALDFYDLFLGGLASGEIDYDARSRDREVETSRQRAMQKVLELIDAVARIPLGMADRQLRVCSDRACESTELSRWSRSTVRRELQFLRSHTLHHYALLGVLAKVQEVELPVGFGVAPSTIQHEKALTG